MRVPARACPHPHASTGHAIRTLDGPKLWTAPRNILKFSDARFSDFGGRSSSTYMR
jgi:hypothetical protein